MERILGIAWLLWAAGLTGGAAAADNCAPAGGLHFICGPNATEDLVRVPGTHWIVGSGMIEGKTPGRLHLIDAAAKTWEVLYPGTAPVNEWDSKSYAVCPGPPDPGTFGAHGIAIRDDGGRAATLLAVNHGREAVEVFKIRAAGAKPSIRWVGCVPMSKDVSLNSIAFLGDGFVTTKFYDPSTPEGFMAIASRQPTGGVLEWHPGSGVRMIPGTELCGANGIEVSGDGKTIFVAAWGTQEIVRFSLGNGKVDKHVVRMGFSPDNLRWAPDGKILVAGQNGSLSNRAGAASFKGWTIVKLDPKTLEFTELARDDGQSPLQNVSVALEVDGTLWIGAFRADRVAYQ